jgi:hypothetical protein
LNSPDFARYVFAAVLGLVFVVLTSANLAMKVRSRRTGKFISVIPLLGGLSGCLALLIVPLDLWRWCWLPLVLDPGCLILILAVPYMVLSYTAWHAFRGPPRSGPTDSAGSGTNGVEPPPNGDQGMPA